MGQASMTSPLGHGLLPVPTKLFRDTYVAMLEPEIAIKL